MTTCVKLTVDIVDNRVNVTVAPVNGLGFAMTETELVDVRITRSLEREGGDKMSSAKDDLIIETVGGVAVALGVRSEPRFYQSQSSIILSKTGKV